MAKAYKATTHIQHGKGSEVVEFFPGDVVKGLSKDEMAQLWDAGALEEATVADSSGSDAPAAESTAEGESTQDDNA